MTVDYAAARADAAAGITEGGTTATLRKPGTTSGPAHNPTRTPGAEYECKVLVLDYRLSERDGVLVQANDRKVMIAAEGLAVAPEPGDALTVGGVAYAVVSAMPFAPGGSVVYYEAQVRA